MASTEIKLGGKSGLVVFVIALSLLAYRFTTIGEVKDPELEKAMRQYLMSDLGGQAIDQLKRLKDTEDYEGVLDLAQDFNEDGISIYSLAVSKPLLSFSTKTDAVVRVEYSLPESVGSSDRKTKYFRCTHGSIAGWRVTYSTSKLSYYLNF